MRQFQLLPASGGWGARLESMANICELLINLVNFDEPKMLSGLNQTVSDGLLDYALRAQGHNITGGKAGPSLFV